MLLRVGGVPPLLHQVGDPQSVGAAAVHGDNEVDGRILAVQRSAEQHLRAALTGMAAGVRVGLPDLGPEQGAHLAHDPVRDLPAAVWAERRVVAPVQDDTAVAVSDRVVECVHGEGAAAERPAGAGELQRGLQDQVGAIAGLAESVVVRRDLALDIGEDVIGVTQGGSPVMWSGGRAARPHDHV